MNKIPALLTDFYQLTMAYGYWRLGMAERESVFHLFFRRLPFSANYVIHCGLEAVIDYLRHWQFSAEELAYLEKLPDAKGQRLFSTEFLDYLSRLRFTGDLYAIPEGQLVFPNEPMLRVQAPILQAQLIETALVNLTSFASLIATKASRVCAAAQNDSVLEFGLRRAQGPDGGLTASRAAYVGGCQSVSNTLAAMLYQIPPVGTMAHSWVMAFADEITAFEKFSQVFAGNTVLLVDTYDSVAGVHHAIEIGKQLRANGNELLGIRLDSGDLNDLSRKARELLDRADFREVKIVASGDLDEERIAHLKAQGAPIDIWGVGTRLTTGWSQPALDAAYKLAAIRDEQGHWQYKIKRSNDPSKTTSPGIQQVRRFFSGNRWLSDIIYDVELGVPKNLPAEADDQQDLLLPVFSRGKLVYRSPSLAEIQQFSRQQLTNFCQSSVTEYSVQVEARLQAKKAQLLQEIAR
jgi:nicotinate phosphoribosyltransferase